MGRISRWNGLYLTYEVREEAETLNMRSFMSIIVTDFGRLSGEVA